MGYPFIRNTVILLKQKTVKYTSLRNSGFMK
jgi:hypothetical protein